MPPLFDDQIMSQARHIQMPSIVRCHKCEKCGKILASLANLRKHEAVHKKMELSKYLPLGGGSSVRQVRLPDGSVVELVEEPEEVPPVQRVELSNGTFVELVVPEDTAEPGRKATPEAVPEEASNAYEQADFEERFELFEEIHIKKE